MSRGGGERKKGRDDKKRAAGKRKAPLRKNKKGGHSPPFPFCDLSHSSARLILASRNPSSASIAASASSGVSSSASPIKPPEASTSSASRDRTAFFFLPMRISSSLYHTSGRRGCQGPRCGSRGGDACHPLRGPGAGATGTQNARGASGGGKRGARGGRARGEKNTPPGEIKNGGEEKKAGAGKKGGARVAGGGDLAPLQESLKIDLLEGRASCEALPCSGTRMARAGHRLRTRRCTGKRKLRPLRRQTTYQSPPFLGRIVGEAFGLPRGSRYLSPE